MLSVSSELSLAGRGGVCCFLLYFSAWQHEPCGVFVTSVCHNSVSQGLCSSVCSLVPVTTVSDSLCDSLCDSVLKKKYVRMCVTASVC